MTELAADTEQGRVVPEVAMMAAGIQAAKKDLRRKIQELLRSIPKDSIVNQSRVATTKLFSLSEYRDAKRIGVYLSMPSGELSTRSIVHDALRNGKEVFIPYLHKVVSPLTQQKSSIMDMLALESIEEFESLEPDRWGIPSLKPSQVVNKKNCLGGYGVCPQGGDEATEDGHGLDLIVMPGMAFDHGFRRLGHGKGYYDLFLTRYSEKKARSKTTTSKMPFLVSLSLEEQMLPPTEEIPVLDHDWPVDAVIIGDGRLLVHQRRQTT